MPQPSVTIPLLPRPFQPIEVDDFGAGIPDVRLVGQDDALDWLFTELASRLVPDPPPDPDPDPEPPTPPAPGEPAVDQAGATTFSMSPNTTSADDYEAQVY